MILCPRHLIAFIFAAIQVVGCRTLYDKGPAPSEVISCRHKWQQGLEAAQRKQWYVAEKLFANAVETCPNDERARQYYAETLWRRGEREQALTQMSESVKLSGHDPSMSVRLGEMCMALGRHDQAVMHASHALARQAELSSAWALRGDIDRCCGKFDRALAHYHRALSVRPNYPRVQFAVARILYQQGESNQALVMLHALVDAEASEQIPVEVVHLEGLIYKSLARYDDAMRSFQAAAAGQMDADLLFEMAEVELCAGRTVHAMEIIQRALVLNPHHQPSRALMVKIDQSHQRVANTISRLPR